MLDQHVYICSRHHVNCHHRHWPDQDVVRRISSSTMLWRMAFAYHSGDNTKGKEKSAIKMQTAVAAYLSSKIHPCWQHLSLHIFHLFRTLKIIRIFRPPSWSRLVCFLNLATAPNYWFFCLGATKRNMKKNMTRYWENTTRHLDVSIHHLQKLLFAQFSLCVHKGGLKPHFISFCFHSYITLPTKHEIFTKWTLDQINRSLGFTM